ncbi:MAG: hypothetical protein ABFS05_09855 [Bacteroidota bacterium]
MTESTNLSAVENCVRRCRRVARVALVIVTLFWITFGIITGVQEHGNFAGLLDNYTSLIPWLIIFLLWVIAWRWEIIGGLMIITFSVIMAFRLGVFGGDATEGLMIITPLAMTGFMFTFIGLRILAAKKAEDYQ